MDPVFLGNQRTWAEAEGDPLDNLPKINPDADPENDNWLHEPTAEDQSEAPERRDSDGRTERPQTENPRLDR